MPAEWYAAYTKHHHEKTAAELLARKGFEVFLPLYRSAHRWKDRTKTVDLPLFPGYLFLRTDLMRKLDILRTAGVFWLVGNGDCACPVPETEIDAVRKIIESSSRFEPHPLLKTGDRVRIQSGPLTGIEGILIRVKGQYRVVLSVELLQKAVGVEVELSAVHRLNPRGAGASARDEARRITS